jgi:hypothetical protein
MVPAAFSASHFVVNTGWSSLSATASSRRAMRLSALPYDVARQYRMLGLTISQSA